MFSHILVFLMVTISVNAEWSYAHKDTWGDSYPTCGNGVEQSPIDVKSSISKKVSYLGHLNLRQVEFDHCSNMVLVNNGHSLQLNIKSGVTLGGAGLSNDFKVAQLHFHWGRVNSKGSEHFLDSVQYPMEMHIVTFNSKLYKTLDLAVNQKNGVAVVSQLFKITKKPNENLNPIVKQISQVVQKGSSVKVSDLEVPSLLHANRTHYFRYPGSLTTPGCQENVIWTVMQRVNHLSHAQIKAFRTARHSGHTISGNFRNVQLLHNRKILRSF